RPHPPRRRDHVLRILSQAGEESSPWPHRRPREGVRPARVRERGRHLGDRIHEAVVHDRHQDPGDRQAAEAARAQAEVPAVELAGDDGPDAECPQRPHPRVSPKSAVLEVLLTYLLIGDRTALPFGNTPPPENGEGRISRMEPYPNFPCQPAEGR